jgi:hypothetical protein
MMVKDALILSNSYFNFLDKITNPEEYIQLDDSIISVIQNFDESDGADLSRAAEIVKRIRNRELYEFIGEIPVNSKINKDAVLKDFLTINNPNNIVTEKDIELRFFSIDYGFGDKNPFNYIHFYRSEDTGKSFIMPSHKVSVMIPSVFKEYYIRIYCKTLDKCESVRGMYEAFKIKFSKDLNSEKGFTTPIKKLELNFLSFKRQREDDDKVDCSFNSTVKFNKIN